jgi:aspartyl-tRNA(Asn)/glutamyl-tRNA(Gln) amidotransferase subunit B
MGLDAVEETDLHHFCEAAVQELSDEAELVRQGNTRVLMKLVGEVMKLSRGRADAQLVRKHLEDMLNPRKTGEFR